MSLNTLIRDHILQSQGDFNTLALAVFSHQYENCQPYQAYCKRLNKTPEKISSWNEVPAVSTEVFREYSLCTFPPSTAKFVFQTSGTSQEIKGKHYYHDMALYEAAVQMSFMKGLGLSSQDRALFRILTPSFTEVPTSSLYFMFQKALEWYGLEGSRFYFSNNELDEAQLAQDLAQDAAQQRPVALLGTAFSYVNFSDYLQEQQIQLKCAPGSRLLETGGLKGRTRSVSRTELYQSFSTLLGLDLDKCYSEYGMTELSSQSYSRPNSHHFFSPPWMPIQIIDPENGKEVEPGKTGLVQFFDLANLSAVSAVMTSDLAIRHEHGFELIGRAPQAVIRGCSTSFEI